MFKRIGTGGNGVTIGTGSKKKTKTPAVKKTCGWDADETYLRQYFERLSSELKKLRKEKDDLKSKKKKDFRDELRLKELEERIVAVKYSRKQVANQIKKYIDEMASDKRRMPDGNCRRSDSIFDSNVAKRYGIVDPYPLIKHDAPSWEEAIVPLRKKIDQMNQLIRLTRDQDEKQELIRLRAYYEGTILERFS